MEQEEDLILDDDGDIAPQPRGSKAKKRIHTHLKFARKTVKLKQNGNRKPKPQVINKDNAEEKRAFLIQAESFAENKNNLIDTVIKQEIEKHYPEIIEEKLIGWEPFPGPQTQFLAADEYEVLFSGGRAPGKSDALMMDALRYCNHRDFRGLVIRKAMDELRDLIRRAKQLYPLCYPGTRWKEQEKLFTFPSGATIEFGYCDHEDDVARYQGQEYTWLGIDELTEIPKEETYEKLIMSVRKGGASKNYIRATTNPNGPGKGWVKKRFVDKGQQNSTIVISTYIPQLDRTIVTTRKWIHGTVFDNPKIMAEKPEYIAQLQQIDNEILRKQWLDGDWDSAEGLAFDEFERKKHVIEPFNIPDSWFRFRACDWGYKTKAVCLWFAIDFEGKIYVYRELVTTKVLAKDFGQRIREIEEAAGERVRYGILDASAWSQRGENAPPPAEDMAGLVWRPSDRTKHSRITGKLQVHNFLQIDPDTDFPKVQIVNTCTDLISCLTSLPMDKNDHEDVDTNADDHSYDAFRYGLMSRPKMNNNYTFANEQSQQPVIFDQQFGY